MKKKNKCVIAKIYSKETGIAIKNNIIDHEDSLFLFSSTIEEYFTPITIFMSDKSAKKNDYNLGQYLKELDYFVDILTAESIVDDVEYEIRNYTDAELDLIYGIFK
ncbi:MAG: hypothetical protein ACC657_17385 [Thiohalomonadales bacterium]